MEHVWACENEDRETKTDKAMKMAAMGWDFMAAMGWDLKSQLGILMRGSEKQNL